MRCVVNTPGCGRKIAFFPVFLTNSGKKSLYSKNVLPPCQFAYLGEHVMYPPSPLWFTHCSSAGLPRYLIFLIFFFAERDYFFSRIDFVYSESVNMKYILSKHLFFRISLLNETDILKKYGR
jgi:hypothetical protein